MKTIDLRENRRAQGSAITRALLAASLVCGIVWTAFAWPTASAESDAGASPASRLPVTDDRARTAERLVAVLDYVASDYAAAVAPDGKVTDAAEYEEQLRMVASAKAYAQELPAIALADVNQLEAAVHAKAPPPEVARRCALVRARAIERYPIAMAPAVPPVRERARTIYAASCVSCHGASGVGDGPMAKDLTPAPVNMLDADAMAPVTPYRVYCDVTYGIAGTAMPALLTPTSDRWSIAFLAVAMRHEATLAEARAKGALPGPVEGKTAPRIGLATLASSTDAELSSLLADAFPDAGARAVELARLRVEAPFEATLADAPAALARRLMGEAVLAAEKGDRAEADRLVLDGYLRGIEELEAPLRSQDPELVTAIEDAVMRLRAAIAETSPDAQEAVELRANELQALLGRAEQKTDASRAGSALIAFAAALLVLREGLEAALIIAAILAVVRRTGLPGSARRAVHIGWTSALVAGVGTFVLARTAISALAMSREVVEAVVSLLAAAVLFATSFWLISKADGKRWLAYVKSQASGSAAAGGTFGLFSVAFLAAYREAFESVLFFEALMGGEASRALPLALGALAGAVLLTGAVAAIGFLEKKLPLGLFFGVSGALLSALSVVLLGHGVHALQSSALLLPRPIDAPRIAWLGVYPDAVSLGAQGALLLVVAVVTVVVLRGGGASAETGTGARPA